jgi:hypothetical protein
MRSMAAVKSAWVHGGACAGSRQRGLVDQVGEVGAVKPGVSAATCSRSHPGASVTFLRCTSGCPARPFLSGRSTSTWRSKRPARSSAGSRISGRLVAARMISPTELSKPSISVSSWLSVCSFSSWPPPMGPPTPRARPSASSSSMKMMAGACCAGLLEQVAHPRRADADEHLDELAAGDREERHPGLAGHGLGQQRLAGAGRADQQHALGHARARGGRTPAGSSGNRRSRLQLLPWPRRHRRHRQR